jgi:dTMP kinase
MGCGGNVKETNDSVRRGPPAAVPKALSKRHEEDPRGKLPPEVLDGFGRILKSFYNLGTQPVVTSRPENKPKAQAAVLPASNGQITAETDPARLKAQQLLDIEKQEVEKERLRQAELERQRGEEAAKLSAEKAAADQRRGAEYHAQALTNPFQALLSGDEVKTLQANQERGFSPEPPRVEDLSDEDGERYEDPNMRAARLEKERLAREEAERRAALLREEEEKVAAERKGAMNLMQSEADNILSKYQ